MSREKVLEGDHTGDGRYCRSVPAKDEKEKRRNFLVRVVKSLVVVPLFLTIGINAIASGALFQSLYRHRIDIWAFIRSAVRRRDPESRTAKFIQKGPDQSSCE